MGAGRPTKLDDEIIQAFNTVLNEGINAIILTDEEMVLLVNDILPENNKFSYSAFKDWKAFATDVKKDTTDYNAMMYDKIRSVIKKALTIQKQNLFTKMQNDKQAWQKYAWIIERKFDEWNIRNKIEQTVSAKVETKLIRPDGSEWTVENNEDI